MESILHDRRDYRGEAAAAGRPGKAWVLACGLDDGESRSSTSPISNFETIDEDCFALLRLDLSFDFEFCISNFKFAI